ncbi:MULTISPECIES: fumarylacetoacetate hydrolase family protein [unclassified Cupriavidus]|uniref:fumarylacetoacetate hydrolase family protein n=1 Tax=unclassified Cupriavidus TaxID=2640874 RepID=UPI001C002B19|nr:MULTISPECIES: fumarylacetoacetate hydrolase family protein [unclassified Cupriavidus]MCA3185776.1 fumarylacetoacetate hydrolase family protein [Cupriavidus sp.]MCA3190779.1 fumarylacetoacetate hydrolase family protein [Cupriavidus sp.]MCA3199134.1 fumarylacetoacetate hydrolase family protein [Cupriavidus sp.]MCA3205071.1 fumarylacetoacetate hydrolase family protein [Cupriavidus sp.]MCA3209142.1 fumarylacetoacetate hydrolase family protein [Cupriavidus sp.]
MTDFVIQPAPQPSVAVAGSEARFPIRRVFCVGRNYAAHAREMGKDPDREPPFFFTKPADAVVAAEGTVPYPPMTENLHHEIELVVAIGKAGANVKPEQALDLVWGYGVGVDLTRRDLQDVAKKMSRPWDWSKSFDASGPCGPLQPASSIGHPSKGAIWLKVNGETRQEGDLTELIWPVADVISYISEAMTLQPGDLIFTGTPAGVGALNPGDAVTAGVEGVGEIAFAIGKR